MKMGSIMYANYVRMLIQSSKELDFIKLKTYSSDALKDDCSEAEDVLTELEQQDVILLYRTADLFWEEIEGGLREIGKKIPIVCVGHDPSYWNLSTVEPEVVDTWHSYIVLGGEENFCNVLRYIAREVLGMDVDAPPPQSVPWEGLYHPDAPTRFERVEDYLQWYQPRTAPTVGLLFSRYYWVNNDLEVEDALIRELEKRGMNVIPTFSYAAKDEGLGAKGSGEVIQEYFTQDGAPRIDALVKLETFFLARNARQDITDVTVATEGVELLKSLDVPVFGPVTSYYRTVEEWENDPQGLGAEVYWSIGMPEFEGIIEPVIVGTRSKGEDGGTVLRRRIPVEEKCSKIAERVGKWIKLRQKPAAERRVAFILHNNPCASVEATVGAGAHLDTLESVARIMKRMKENGYSVQPPADGKELIDTIMERKAISEFRWTTVDEIVGEGGALALVPADEYTKWFSTLSSRVKDRVNGAWGEPPGKEMNGVPAAMVYDGKIVVTEVQYGNAVVCVQPKRGCAGARCDGQVCKILHDPDVPLPHQYLATYRYLENTFGADVVVHVGTHGNLEFLPGKATGLSRDCMPDIAIGSVPHLYIYNGDNPPEGTIAKRRSYATLVNHMQAVMTQGGLYDELEELDRYLGEYEKARLSDGARAHSLEQLILETVRKTNLDKEIRLDDTTPFEEVTKAVHEALSRVRNAQIQDGMHIFGDLPQGDKRIDFINSILRYNSGDEVSLRGTVASLMGLNLSELLDDQGRFHPDYHRSYGQLLEEIDRKAWTFVREFLKGDGGYPQQMAERILGKDLRNPAHLDALGLLKERALDLDSRISRSLEIDSLFYGFAGGYIPSGPSGLITRGRDDILPTGRNFYSLDPQRLPTKAAWEVGKRLAQAVIDKHLREEGRMPENVAIYWMCNDIMWSDGEGMAQIMHLIGVRPVWQPNGRVRSFEVVPLNELGRPRIDVTIRVSGITRDNFPNCVELIDEAIQTVASLDEPEEVNFVRKHSLEQVSAGVHDSPSSEAWRDATLRIFASKPGTYGAGVHLAVYASAWREEKDLADVFVYWNGYAYGKGIFGKGSHPQLADSLKTVDLTYNKSPPTSTTFSAAATLVPMAA